MRPAVLAALAVVLLITSCGSERAAMPGAGDATPRPAVQAGPIGLSPGNAPLRGITNSITAAAIDATGTPQNPTSTFHAATDRSIVAVLHLADLPAGTKISYVRYLDNKFVDSKTSALAKSSRSFFFTFTAQPGKNLAIGHYRLRLYVNEQAAWETLYQVA